MRWRRRAHGPTGARPPRDGVVTVLRRVVLGRRGGPRVALRPAVAVPRPGSPSGRLRSVEPSAVAHSAATSSTTIHGTPALPVPSRGAASDDSDGDDRSDSDGAGDHHPTETDNNAPPPRPTRNANKGRKNTKWVAKLLNQVGFTKDKVHHHRRRRREAKGEPTGQHCPQLFTSGTLPHRALLCRILAFLEPREPARHCATVNSHVCEAVREYYGRFCPPPRPRGYLARKIFGETSYHGDGLLSTILGMLSMPERVQASATCRSFLRTADALPLHICGRLRLTQLLRSIPVARIEERFQRTPSLHLDAVDPADALLLVQLMSESEDDHFAAVTELVLTNTRGFHESQFVGLVQALFSDRVSRTIRKLVLSGMGLEDGHYCHLAKLFYDGRFPVLEHLDVSNNAFSSRFMRDWARCFHEHRFHGLLELNVSDTKMGTEDIQRFFGCLAFVPNLRHLHFARIGCSADDLRRLSVATPRMLHLKGIRCSAICPDYRGMKILIEGLHGKSCNYIEQLDFSGNALDDETTINPLAISLRESWWPHLKVLDISYSQLGPPQVKRIFSAMCSSTNRIQQLQLAGNSIDEQSFGDIVLCMERGGMQAVQRLSLADNRLTALEFEQLGNCLRSCYCPMLVDLFLNGNSARAEGISRFRHVLDCSFAEQIRQLDLSDNKIPAYSLVTIADTLMNGRCKELFALNLSRNLSISNVTRFQQLIRSRCCPSLVYLQVGYAQSEVEGREFVKHVLMSMSVETLRALKQEKFEKRMWQIGQTNIARAAINSARCKRQVVSLRQTYDHMEGAADQALRRRKQIRKSNHLHIHEEIKRLRQQKYHERICKELG